MANAYVPWTWTTGHNAAGKRWCRQTQEAQFGDPVAENHGLGGDGFCWGTNATEIAQINGPISRITQIASQAVMHADRRVLNAYRKGTAAEVYHYWHRATPEAASHERLIARHREHSLLQVHEGRLTCPATAADARRSP